MKHVFMGTPKVSIIVPVYNAGSYFSKLLDSLTGQTLKEIEIILVLDCPTDGSDRVAEEYAARDGRIVLVRNRENLHVGFSRNEGLKIARGEYIGFCDHDDWVEPEMFEKMYHQGKETGAEVVVADYYVTNGKEKWRRGFPQAMPNARFIQESLSELLTLHPPKREETSIRCCGLIWEQLYQRKFLEDHHITFPDNRITTYEDRTFLIQVYTYVQKINRIPEAFYYHLWHATHTGSNYDYRSIARVSIYLTGIYHFLQQKGIFKTHATKFCEGVVLFLYSSFRHELRHLPVGKAVKQLKLIRQDVTLQAAIRKAFGRLWHYPPTKVVFLFLVFNPFCKRVRL